MFSLGGHISGFAAAADLSLLDQNLIHAAALHRSGERTSEARDQASTGREATPARPTEAASGFGAGRQVSGSRSEPLVSERAVGVAVDPSQFGVPGVPSPVLLAPQTGLLQDAYRSEVFREAAGRHSSQFKVHKRSLDQAAGNG